MKYIFLIIFCFFFISCSTNKVVKSDWQNLKVVKIEECKTFYRLKSVNRKNDTINIISFKKNPANLKLTMNSKIAEQNTYNFKVENIRTRVSTMEELGHWVVIDNDTLWRGPSNKVPPKYLLSRNTVGLQISN